MTKDELDGIATGPIDGGEIAMRTRSFFKVGFCMGLLSLLAATAHGETLVMMGGTPVDAFIGNNIIIGSAGGTVTVFLVVTDTVSGGLGPMRGYQMMVPCSATPIGGATGNVDHNIGGPTACGGSPCVNLNDAAFPFGPGQALPLTDTGDCFGGGANPNLGAITIFASDAVDIPAGVFGYLGEVSYVISAGATGDHYVTILNPDIGAGGDSFIRGVGDPPPTSCSGSPILL